MVIDAKVISEIEAKVKRHMEDDSTGHDWWHIDRVRRNALTICRQEHGDAARVEMIALLHDVDDWKLKAESQSESLARHWLTAAGVSSEEAGTLCEIIERISFKGHGVADEMPFLDGKIVQDADRLDAIGAIGIARCFAYGGAKGRAIYDPEDAPELHQSFEDYKTKSGPSINHFHEKLLHLKDRMHTPTARKMAAERHDFLEQFLDQFQKEWSGC
ncbi:MAG: HD domain-containing protein [Planctomycetaceae bacterium]|nr:HD domain-containing protein [Planctomycetaceae bacterium]